MSDSISPARHLTVVGLGNIGSHLVPHLARMASVGQITLVDPGRYEVGNVASQSIMPGEAGRGKVQVQALRLRRIRPDLHVECFGVPVADVPLGRLRADIVLACLDSRAARLTVNEASRHLGVPLIDAGVHADGVLARVSVFGPADHHACLECSWDQHDYDLVEQVYACQPADSGENGAPPSGAPAELGALAAALQAIECRAILDGRQAGPADSHELIVDAQSRRALPSSYARSATCRLSSDHAPWQVMRLAGLPEELTLTHVLRLGTRLGSGNGDVTVEVDGQAFVTAATCLRCGGTTETCRLRRSLTPRERTCRACGGRLVSSAAQMVSALDHAASRGGAGDRTLRALGLETGDILTLRRGDDVMHVELAGRSGGSR